MSTQDPRDQSQSPEELLAETQSMLGGEDSAPTEASEAEPHETAVADSRTDLPEAKGGTGMSAGMWISLIVGAVIVVLLLIFIVQNNVPADFQYFGWRFQLPLGVAMLFAAIGGILIAGIIGSVRIFILSRRLRKIKRALGR